MFKTYAAIVAGVLALSIALVSLTKPGVALGQDPGLRSNAEPVLLELFTSQGCSSCPPADRLAAKLVPNPDLVIVSRPVTYWDRLGWKDTLALEANTDLQRRYAWRGLNGRNGVYTPQIVVDGTFGVVGSQEQQLRNLIHQSSHRQSAAIRVKQLGDGGYRIGLGGESDAPAELVVLALTSHAKVDIGRGENSGHRLGYTNVLRSENRVARWNGGQQSYVVNADQFTVAGADRYAIIVREEGAGRVLAAQYLDL